MASIKSDTQSGNKRQAELLHWFQGILPTLDSSASPENAELRPLSGDASFRRYFTGHAGDKTWVLVDAPPAKEDSRTFVQVATCLQNAGINVPRVFEVNYPNGFMCLSFLGETLLWEKLDTLKNANRISGINEAYQQAFDSLLKIQGIREGSDILLPYFDREMLLTEMELFREWFCEGIMGLVLNKKDNALLDHFIELLMESALSQQQVFVHRDYHSRNLMVDGQGRLGVLDFQDAVFGPVTYDLVSLIKDCYISWPQSMIREWALHYANMAQTAGILDDVVEEKFLYHFDMMGIQRHLKATGIFARLYLRDGKPGYLADIPRTLGYIKEVLGEYPEMFPLAQWFERNIYPMLVTRLNSISDRVPQS